MSDATSIDDTSGDQEHATVKSVLAQAPDEFATITAPSMDEVRLFLLEMEGDTDRQEAKRDGALAANYYFGRLQMKELESHLRIEFPKTWTSKFRVVENFTKSVSKQLSTIYKKPAKREAVNKRNSELSAEKLKDQTEIIDFIYKWGGINRSYQEIERFAKWAKSVLVKVSFQTETGKTKIKPYTPQFYDVMVSEGGILRAVIVSDYEVGKVGQKESDARRFWVWTSEETVMFQGGDINMVGKPEVNPLGMIPFVFFNDDLPVENEKPYLHADTMLSNTNLAINRSLTDAMSLIKFQTYGQPYIIGSDPDKLPKGSGHDNFWHIQQGKDDSEMPKVGMLSPEGDLESILIMVERVANGYATSRGLAPDTFTAIKTGTGASSGIALKIKNHVLIEMRESEEEKYIGLENEVFNLVRAIHNFHTDAVGGTDLPELDEGINLRPIFDDNSLAFENPVEVMSQKMVEVDRGLLKRTDYVRATRPNWSEEDAKDYLIAISKENDELGVVTTLDDLDKALANNRLDPDDSE